MAESLESYISRIKQEHERSGKGTMEFFLKQIRELAAKAVPNKADEEKLRISGEAAKKAQAAGKEMSPEEARDAVANNNVIETNSNMTRSYMGKMLFFCYEAKGRMTLPYWDKYPLIFMISTKGNSALGINLHYLPPVERARLLFNLMTLANSADLNVQTKLTMTYKFLNNSAKFRYFKPCIKRYLFSQIRSRVMLINPKQWNQVVFMPLANFQKQTEFKVWQDSINMIQKQTLTEA